MIIINDSENKIETFSPTVFLVDEIFIDVLNYPKDTKSIGEYSNFVFGAIKDEILDRYDEMRSVKIHTLVAYSPSTDYPYVVVYTVPHDQLKMRKLIVALRELRIENFVFLCTFRLVNCSYFGREFRLPLECKNCFFDC